MPALWRWLILYKKPLALGADIVIYATTKRINGQGRLLGGAVLSKRSFVEDVFLPFYRQTGAAISAFNAWVMLKSLETLPLRVAAQSETAAKIADWLFQHPNIKKISYPGHASHPQHDLAKQQMSGFGSLLAFEVAGGGAAAFTALNNLHLTGISNNLVDSKSLACHPYTTTHSKMSPEDRARHGISGGRIRLSVGLDDAEDPIEDFD